MKQEELNTIVLSMPSDPTKFNENTAEMSRLTTHHSKSHGD